MLQTFPEPALELSTTLSPAQKVVGPEAVIVGVGGIGLEVTTVGRETAEVQPNSTTYTVKEPEFRTLIACVVAPLLQLFPLAPLEVNVTLSPAQKVVGPDAEMVGVGGVGLTVTTVGSETADVQPNSTTKTV